MIYYESTDSQRYTRQTYRIRPCSLKKKERSIVFIHLGDIEGGESYINSVVECEKHMVRGNNEFFLGFAAGRGNRYRWV